LQLHWQHCTWLNTSMPTVAELGIWCYRTRRGDHAVWWISQQYLPPPTSFALKPDTHYPFERAVYAIYVYVHNSLVLRLFDYKYNLHCNSIRFSRNAKAVSNVVTKHKGVCAGVTDIGYRRSFSLLYAALNSLFVHIMHTMIKKHTPLSPIPSSNIGRFAKIFHCQVSSHNCVTAQETWEFSSVKWTRAAAATFGEFTFRSELSAFWRLPCDRFHARLTPSDSVLLHFVFYFILLLESDFIVYLVLTLLLNKIIK